MIFWKEATSTDTCVPMRGLVSLFWFLFWGAMIFAVMPAIIDRLWGTYRSWSANRRLDRLDK